MDSGHQLVIIVAGVFVFLVLAYLMSLPWALLLALVFIGVAYLILIGNEMTRKGAA
jgi:threonine/homoserine/homoserine lactone efflux protein